MRTRLAVAAPSTVAVLFLILMAAGGAAQTGAIEGTVRFEGAAPPPEMLEVTKNQEVCGESIQSRQLVISNGRVAYAVASIDGLAGETPAGEFLLSNADCSFDPPVLAAAAGGTLVVDNQDDVLHNTHLNFLRGSASRTVGNWALSRKGAKVTEDRPLRRAGEIDVECDAHPWMHAKILVFDHPYFAVTDGQGGFHIADVPPGTYSLKLWHGVMGVQEQEVTVESGGTTAVEFVFSSADIAAGGGQ